MKKVRLFHADHRVHRWSGGRRKPASPRGMGVSAEALHDVNLMEALVVNAIKECAEKR